MWHFLRTYWDEIRGKAKYDILKWIVGGIWRNLIVTFLPVIGTAIFAWVREASWVSAVCVFFGIFVLLVVFLVILWAWVKSWPEPKSFKVTATNQIVAVIPEYEAFGSPQRCFINVRNNEARTIKGIRAEILEIDTNSAQIPNLTGIVLPATLPLVEDCPDSVNPKLAASFVLLTNLRLKEAFGKWAVIADVPGRSFVVFLLNREYRVRLRIAAEDTEPLDEVYRVQFSGNEEMAEFSLSE